MGSIKVFYIDKQKFLREMVEEILKERDLGVYTLENGDDCIYLIEDLSPEIILLDVATIMPIWNVFYKNYQEKQLEMPIFFTGFPEDEDLVIGMEGIFKGFIEKPLKVDTFLGQINAFLNI